MSAEETEQLLAHLLEYVPNATEPEEFRLRPETASACLFESYPAQHATEEAESSKDPVQNAEAVESWKKKEE